MKTPLYKIGDEIKNTGSYGDVSIEDIFTSDSTRNYVYLIQAKSSESYFLAFEDELMN